VNYLAHFYLAALAPESTARPANVSGGSPEALVGSLLGEFVKGDEYRNYPAPVADAIMMHRRIDAFTDAHEVPRRSRARLAAHHRHTKGILIDIFYDHFLAVCWADFADMPLEAFAQKAYASFRQVELSYPLRLTRTVYFMEIGDWLTGYRNPDGIAQALRGLSRRISRPTLLARGIDDLHRHHDDLQRDFLDFFPQLVNFAVSRQSVGD
jgi:acyl carrier protein phosphodiesterase